VRVTVVGSADAFNGAGRSHSCYLVEHEGCGRVMVDFGATALAAIRRIGRAPTEVDTFLVTHLHGDHIGGFPFLLIDAMFNAVRKTPLEIVGPVGTRDRIETLFHVAYGVVADFPRRFAYEVREISPGEETQASGFTVRAYPAAHMDPPDLPLCLRVRAPTNASVAFSGDTEMCEGLFAAADGADLLIAECTALRPPTGRHCTWEDWRSALLEIRASRILLSHLGQDVRDAIPELLREMNLGDRLAFADDGLRVEV
jgi:ribonuclease BN (tRNA processing enzyme)